MTQPLPIPGTGLHEQPNAVNPKEQEHPRLYCFLNSERVCDASCMAYNTVIPDTAATNEYRGQVWPSCHLLLNAHRAGKHLVIIASAATKLLSARHTHPTPSPPEPGLPMGMSVEVMTVDQKMDLSTGAVSNVLTLRMANGEFVSATVSDNDLQKVVLSYAQTHVGSGQTRAVAQAVSPMSSLSTEGPALEVLPHSSDDIEYDGTGTAVFGGVDDVDGAPEPTALTSALEAVGAGPRPTTVKTTPARTVSRDEVGNPILSGGLNPTAVAGGSDDDDEDGVAQA